MTRIGQSPSTLLGTSNEPLLVQALEEAILFRRLWADLNPEPFRSEDRERVREYRKLLQRARAKILEQRTADGNTHPGKVR